MTKNKPSLQIPIIVVLLVTAAALVVWIRLVFGNYDSRPTRAYIVFLATALMGMLSLIVYLTMRYQSKRFDLFHPLFYACWFFFIPQIWLSALYYSDERVPLSLPLQAMLFDRNVSFEYSLNVLFVGVIALGLGFVLPVGRSLGSKIPRSRLTQGTLSDIKVPIQNLILIGLGFELVTAMVQAVTNATGTISQFSGVLQFFSLFYDIGIFLAWYAFFRKEKGWRYILVFSFLLLLLEFLSSGSRATLFRYFLMVLAAYQYSNIGNLSLKKLRQVSFIWVPLIITVLLVGYFYGTAFRRVRAQELSDNVSYTSILSLSSNVIDIGRESGIEGILEQSVTGLTERAQGGLISLSVILTYADARRSEEIAAGTDNKIIKDLINAFIPRFIFPERASIGDNKHLGQIYYGYPLHSPGQTVFGDLFKEFSWSGLILGMILMGVTLRGIYVWLIEGSNAKPLCAAIYFLILKSTNFENQYSAFFPTLSRVLMLVIVVFVLIEILSSVRKRFS